MEVGGPRLADAAFALAHFASHDPFLAIPIQDALLRDLSLQSHRRFPTIDRPFRGSTVLAPWRRVGSERSAADNLYGYRVRRHLSQKLGGTFRLTMVGEPALCSAAVITTHLPPSQFFAVAKRILARL